MDNTECSLDLVMRNIYTTCDPEQTNLVRASTLIDFIKPYLQGEHEALKKLHTQLDPENKNIYLSSEKFYEVLSAWANQVAGSNEGQEDIFNETPSNLEIIDEKQLPFIQSTPRASFGDKLLRSEGILNLSNISPDCISLNFSGAQNQEKSSVAADKMKSLEDHVQYLEHQVVKVTSDADMLKVQLAQAEEYNDSLQKEMERLKIRLHSEQQINEQLQKRQLQNEELTDELNNHKVTIGKLEKLVQQYKKDSLKWHSEIQKLEEINTKLDDNCKKLLEREQDLKNQIITMTEELEIKESKISELTEHQDKLSKTLQQRNSTLKELTNDYELLDYKRNSLEKVISERRYSYPSYNNSFSESIHQSMQDISFDEDFPISQLHGRQKTSDNTLQKELMQASSSENEVGILLHEKETLKFKLDKVIEENDNLHETISVLEEKLRSVISDKNAVELRIADFEANIKEYQNEMSKLTCLEADHEWVLAELQQKTLECDDLSNIAKDNKEVIQNLEEKLQISVSEENKAFEELNSLLKKHTELEGMIQRYKEASDKTSILDAAYKQAQAELHRKTLEFNDLSKCLNDYKKTLYKINKTNEKLEKSLKSLRMELAEYQNNLQKDDAVHNNNILEKDVLLKELEDKIKIKDIEIKRLRNEMEHDNDVKTQLFKNSNALHSKILELKNENISSASRIDETEKKYDEMKEQEANLQSEVNELSKRNGELLIENEHLQNQLKTMEEKLVNEIKKKSDLFDGIIRLETEIQTFRNEHEVESMQFDSISSKFKIECDKNKELCSKNAELSNQLRHLQEIYDNEVSQNSELSAQVGELQNKLMDLSIKLQEKVEECENRELEHSHLIETISSLEKKMEENELAKEAEHFALVSQLEKDLENITKQYDNISQEYHIEMGKNESLMTKIQELENRIYTEMVPLETHQKDIAKTSELNLQLDELKGKMESNMAKNQRLEKDYANEIEKNMELAARVCEMTTANDSLINKCSTEKCKNHHLTSELDRIHNQLATVSEEYQKALMNNAELHTHVTRLENEIEMNSNHMLIMKKDIEQKVEKCQKLGNQIIELKSRVESITNKYDLLMKRYEESVFTNRELTLKFNELESKLDSSCKDYVVLKETHTNEIGKYVELVGELNKKIENLSTSQQNLLDANSFKDFKISALAAQVSEMLANQNKFEEIERKEIPALQSKMEYLHKKNISIEHKYEQEKENNLQISQKYLELQSRLSEKCELIKKLETEKAQLRLTCSLSKHKDFNKKEKTINRLLEKVEELQERITEEVSKTNMLNSTLCDKSRTEEEMKQKLNHVQIRLDSFREIISSTDEQNNQCSLIGILGKSWLELLLLSKSDDDKNIALQKLEALLCKNLEHSQQLDDKIHYLRQDINDSKDILKKTKRKIMHQAQIIFECNEELKRVYLLIKCIADNIYNEEDGSFMLPDVFECEDNDLQSLSSTLKQNVNIIALVLETLSKRCLFILDKKQLDQCILRQLSPNGDTKQFKKYTLKYARPDSPDSPSLEINEVVDTSENNANDSSINHDLPTVLEAFEYDALYQIPMLDFDLSFREVFPNLTDNFLQKLGVKEDNQEEEISINDKEFNAQFKNYFESDMSNIIEKLGQQLHLCQKQHEQCFGLFNEVTSYIKGCTCGGQGDALNPIYCKIQDLRALLPEIVRSSFSLGTLNCGKKMSKCWYLLSYHMNDIQQDLHLSQSIANDAEVGSTSESTDQSDAESTDDKAGIQPTRWPKFVNAIFKWCLFLAVLMTMGIIYLQVENQSNCKIMNPLIDFVKKVQVGQTPFY